jgi:glycosyltransferase involved in cell wall biosynthesis
MAEQRRYDFIVSTIVPARDEEGNIDEFCRQFDAMLRAAPFNGELVYVDDGSVDGTLDKIRENAAKYSFVKYRSHQRNRGLTEALQTGFATASGDVFVFYPADLQYRPEDIPALVEPISRGADISTGWKQGKYTRRFVSRVYNALSRRIFGLKVHDLNSVKAFRREVVENIFLREDWHRYLVVLAANEGYRVDEVKIPLYDRAWGKTKFSLWRIPVGVLDMLAVKFQITFLRKPLLYFGGAGVLSFILGMLIGVWAVYERFVLGTGNRLWLFLILFLTGLGLGLFMMGFVAEGQTALKEEIGDLRRKTQQLLNKKNGRDAAE